MSIVKSSIQIYVLIYFGVDKLWLNQDGWYFLKDNIKFAEVYLRYFWTFQFLFFNPNKIHY